MEPDSELAAILRDAWAAATLPMIRLEEETAYE
jgi:hypothetical protein